MVQVRVLGVALDAAGEHIVLLKPLDEEARAGRVVPIWIGGQEATSILVALRGERMPRPLTHDLMKTLLDSVGAEVERIEVTRIENGTFYGEITLATPKGPLVIDARPSDSVALAVRTDAPLFVADEVVEETGIPAVMVEQAPGEEQEDAGREGADPKEAERELDEFKRFLEDLDPEDFRG